MSFHLVRLIGDLHRNPTKEKQKKPDVLYVVYNKPDNPIGHRTHVQNLFGSQSKKEKKTAQVAATVCLHQTTQPQPNTFPDPKHRC